MWKTLKQKKKKKKKNRKNLVAGQRKLVRKLYLAKEKPFKSLRSIFAEIDNKISPATVRRRLGLANVPRRIA